MSLKCRKLRVFRETTVIMQPAAQDQLDAAEADQNEEEWEADDDDDISTMLSTKIQHGQDSAPVEMELS